MSHLLPQVTKGFGVWSELQPQPFWWSMVLPLTACPSSVPPQVNRNETHMVWTVQAGKQAKLVDHVVPDFLGSDPTYVPTFLCTYRALLPPNRCWTCYWLNMPGSDMQRHALLLLSQLEHLEATEAETEGEEDL
ncbi:hypothetical protein HPG69_017684, partial [Diceros bicornis minor]